MPQATIRCLQYVIGPGRSRQPRSPMPGVYPPGLGAVVCYSQQPPNTYVTGTLFTAPYAPPPAALPCIATYMFAFQSVTGLQEGGQMSSDIMTPCTGIVGNDPIVVTNVYVPVGGGTGPGGENGAIIDAFNMETGEFCDDTFVTVSPDANGNLTSQGNVLGWVNSEANVENITAYNHILPSDKYFQKWDIVEGTGDSSDTASLAVLTVGKNTNPYAFAFYSKPAKSSRFWENKPDIIDRPVKDLGAEIIKWKDAAGEGDPWRNYVVDPAEKLKMQTLIDKVSALEQQVKQLGQSFIKIQERPAVGKEIAEKGAKRG